MQIIKNYVDENRQRFLDELFELLRFPSVSADPKYKGDVLKTADFVAQKLKEAGADNVEVCATDGYPIVYGEKIIDINLPKLSEPTSSSPSIINLILQGKVSVCIISSKAFTCI